MVDPPASFDYVSEVKRYAPPKQQLIKINQTAQPPQAPNILPL